jgi:cell wall-associated NlpC family hydrolase
MMMASLIMLLAQVAPAQVEVTDELSEPAVRVTSEPTTKPFDLSEQIAGFEIDARHTLAHLWMPNDAAHGVDVAGFVEHPQFISALKASAALRGLPEPTRVKLLPEQSSTADRFAKVGEAAVTLREFPADQPGRGDHLTQLLPGEPVWVLDRHIDGATLVHGMDGYLGWVDAKAIEVLDAAAFAKLIDRPRAADQVATALTAARQYLKTPYEWSGRSKAGIDCSGLVQVSFAEAGVLLPRDADQQANVGRLVGTRWFKDALMPGDLLFFLSARRGHVNHVAIYLGDGAYIEAAEPTVQIGSLDPDDERFNPRRLEAFGWARRVIP